MKRKLPNIDTPGFKLPPHYFEELDDKIMCRVQLSKKVTNDHAFKTPEGYFSKLEDKIISQLENPTPGPKVIPFYRKPTFAVAMSIAAILILIFTVIPFNTSEINNPSGENSISINEYVEGGFLDVTPFEMEALLNNDSSTEDFLITYEVSEEELLNYLVENIDESILINEP